MFTVIYLIIVWSALALISIHITSNVLRALGDKRAEEIYQWTLPFAWISWLVTAINTLTYLVGLEPGESRSTWDMVMFCIQVCLSWTSYRAWKNSDDDRWKRLRKVA